MTLSASPPYNVLTGTTMPSIHERGTILWIKTYIILARTIFQAENIVRSVLVAEKFLMRVM